MPECGQVRDERFAGEAEEDSVREVVGETLLRDGAVGVVDGVEEGFVDFEEVGVGERGGAVLG